MVCPSTAIKSTSDSIKRPPQLSSQPFQTANWQLYWENTQSSLAEADRPRSPASNPAIHPTLTYIRGLVLGQGHDHQPIRHWGKQTMSRNKRERTKLVERLGLMLCYLLRSDCSELGLRETVERSVLLASAQTWNPHFIYLFFNFSFQRKCNTN